MTVGAPDAAPPKGFADRRVRRDARAGATDDRPGLFDGGFWTPLLVLRDSALDANLARMSEFCATHGVELAPHAKTTMAPEIIRRQLAHGAWAMTAATPWQVGVLLRLGVRRILLANELVDPDALRWLSARIDEDPSLEILCYADSAAGVEIMDAALAPSRPRRPLDVLVEYGMPGGRAGCRTIEQAVGVARAVADSSVLALRGVSGFEGIVADGDPAVGVARVDAFLRELRGAAQRMLADGLLGEAIEPIVSAGGSAYFDRVVEILGAPWPDGRHVRVVLRSGCYVTHDHGLYADRSPLGPDRRAGGAPLCPALELWSRVLSRPEPGLAIADFGKRDASTDGQLPVPIAIRDADGAQRPAPPGLEVTAVNDQHAYVSVPGSAPLAVGELLALGISHPCTAFDKWRAIPLVDDAHTVIDVIETVF